jgi:KaiC/GvpD/RAD55 family RecA-like ATPase
MPKEWSLEYEYEERIYQDVENLGRYIMSISLRDIPNVFFVNEMSAYLEKYPHIRVFLIEGKNARKRKDITDMFVKTKSKKTAAK